MVFLPQAAQLSSQGGEPKAPRESCQRPPPPVPWVNSAWLVCQFLIVELPPPRPPLCTHFLPGGQVRTATLCSSEENARQKLCRTSTDPRGLLKTGQEKGLFFFFFFN